MVDGVQAPVVRGPALKEAGQTAQACAVRRTVNPVPGGFTAPPPVQQLRPDPAAEGAPGSRSGVPEPAGRVHADVWSRSVPAGTIAQGGL